MLATPSLEPSRSSPLSGYGIWARYDCQPLAVSSTAARVRVGPAKGIETTHIYLLFVIGVYGAYSPTAATTALLNRCHRARMNPHMCVTVRLAKTASARSRSGSPHSSVPA